jgi:hypothetical protein
MGMGEDNMGRAPAGPFFSCLACANDLIQMNYPSVSHCPGSMVERANALLIGRNPYPITGKYTKNSGSI